MLPASRSRHSEIVHSLTALFAERLGISAGEVAPDVELLELGADSLLLLEASRAIHDRFQVNVPFRRMLSDLTSIDRIAAHVAESLPAASREPAPQQSEPRIVPVIAADSPPVPLEPRSPDGLEALFAKQLQVIARQLDVLRTSRSTGASSAPAPPPAPVPGHERPAPSAEDTWDVSVANPPIAEPPPGPTIARAGTAPADVQPYVAHHQIDRRPATLSRHQRQGIAEMAKRLEHRLGGSKRFTQYARRHHADSRTTAGFRPDLKELSYPLFVDRAAGSRIWDIDDNEYVDVSMGFGSLLFGHSPSFVQDAIEAQLARGFCLGPHVRHAARAAELVSELTGMERVAFCNSGTEAVMSALRIARAVTGRSQVALFTGSYHGTFDGVLVRGDAPRDGAWRTVPIAPGILPAMIQDTILLEYGTQRSLEQLDRQAGDLAAILVEPLQSRRPDLTAQGFLQELRRIADRKKAALIFDEVVTGFRMHPGGGQKLFGVAADLATYGKTLGGGMPIGAIAGRSEYMDAVDGGAWGYGDASYPSAQTTIFAGTFFKHPIVMAAAVAVLEQLKSRGPRLQEALTADTQQLTARLDRWFEREQVPIRMASFGSLFRFVCPPEAQYTDLFFYALLLHGVFVWEGRVCYLSTSHTRDDLEGIVAAVERAVGELREMGFLGPAPARHSSMEAPEAPTATSPSHPGDPPRVLALPPAQQEIWATAQLGPEASRAYNLSCTVRLRDRCDVDVLRRAVDDLVRRHEALRVSIDPDGTEQRIRPAVDAPVHVVDVTDVSADVAAVRVDAAIADETQRPFDLTTAPLARFRLIRAHDHDRLVVTVHHLIADAHAFMVLSRDLLALYDASRRGTRAALPQAMQLSDYVRQRTGPEAAADTARAESYWAEQFRDGVPPLVWPAEGPADATAFAAGKECLTLGPAIRGHLARLGARQHATLFATVFAVFGAWLHRTTGQPDVIIGVPSANRDFAGGEHLVANCVTLLPVRSRIDGDPTFLTYLAGVRDDLLTAQEHASISLLRVADQSKVRRGRRRASFVPVTFNIDPPPRPMAAVTPALDIVGNATGTLQYDLSCNITDLDGVLSVELDYNRGLFDAGTVRAWIDQFHVVCEAVCADPERRISALPLLGDAERQRMAEHWNETARDYDVRPIGLLFEEQAARTPDAVAVRSGDRTMTYGELNERANQLARVLRMYGVGREVPVGVCLARSLDLPVAVLAVWKAGGVFLPLDPAYPRERLNYMLADSGAPVVVTSESLQMLELRVAAVISLDREAAVIAAQARTNRSTATVPGDLAYIMYTSGSTGQPKGVLIEHRNLSQYLAWCKDAYHRDGGYDALLHSSIAFDLSLTALLSPWLVGRAVTLVADGRGVDALSDAIAAASAPVLVKVTPSHLRLLRASLTTNAARIVRALIVGGEALPREDVTIWRDHDPATMVVNEYGPTEATVGCVAEMDPAAAPDEDTMPIGRPIANARVYVLDACLEPLPVGVTGELYIGGAGVGRGYHGRASLTAERFVPDPFAGPGGRLYRTGDLVRWRSDGRLVFLGRTDDQIKIRGHRVELGEIEARLRRHPGVHAAAAAVRGAGTRDARLVAFVIATPEAVPSVRELRAFLQETLPESMIPAEFLLVDALPLNASGKVDRAALGTLSGVPAPRTVAYAAPTTPAEMVLASVWAATLHVDSVGIHDNFFELGGDSILAIQVVSRAARAGLNLTPSQIFQYQTIGELAGVAGAAHSRIARASTGAVPLTPIQRWFFEHHRIPPHHWNQAMLLTSDHEVDAARLQQALDSLVLHHDALRLRFHRVADDWQQTCVAPGGEWSVRDVDLAGLAPEQRSRALQEQADQLHASLNLADGPLLRAAIFRQGHDIAPLILLVVHHLAIDIVSWRILLDDLNAVYPQVVAGHDPSLPFSTTSFQEWSERTAAHAVGGALDGQLEYWMEATRHPVARLPVDRRGENTAGSVDVVAVALGKAQTGALIEHVAKRQRLRIHDVVIAALSLAVADITQSRHVVVDIESHGREALWPDDVDLSQTVGWFTAVYPLLIDVPRGAPLDALVGIKEQLLRVPDGGIGYGLLRYLGSPHARARLGSVAAADILFNYEGRFVDEPQSHYFRPARGRKGRLVSADTERSHLLEVNARLDADDLHVEWSFSERLHDPQTVAGFAQKHLDWLARLVTACTDAAPRHVAAEFPAASLTQDTLDRLLSALGSNG